LLNLQVQQRFSYRMGPEEENGFIKPFLAEQRGHLGTTST